MKPLTDRVRIRREAMMWAYLMLAAKNVSLERRELLCWMWLFTWASLGGTKDEVIA